MKEVASRIGVRSLARIGLAGPATLCALTLLDSPGLAATDSAAGWARDVDATVREWLESTRAPSASIAIVEQGRLTYVQAYGHAQLAPPVAATPSSRYPIDSVSKEFTAAAVLLLSERGELSLQDPVRKWFPETGQAANVTLKQLLTHTSGVRDYWPQDFVPPEMLRPITTPALIREWAERPLDFPPGTDWQYSNTGYVLAAAIVERASGQGLVPFLTQSVFAPLGMTRVADYGAGALGPGDARGYTRYGLGPVRPAPREGAGWLFGAAELAMSPGDLARWDVSLIERSLLSATSYQAAFERVRLADGTVKDYGLGLDVEEKDNRLRIGHSGAGSGFLAANRVWPQEKIAIVVLTNNDWASPDDLVDRIAFLVLPPTPAQARARSVFAALQKGTLDRALFSESGKAFLTPKVLADLKASLGPLGPARLIELERQSRRGGMTTRVWRILCRDVRLQAVERAYADGPIEQFMVSARTD